MDEQLAHLSDEEYYSDSDKKEKPPIMPERPRPPEHEPEEDSENDDPVVHMGKSA